VSETERQNPGSNRPGRSSLETNCGIRAGVRHLAGASCLGLGAWLAVLLALPVRAQQTTPHIGYVYPAGGRQGTTFQLTLGGQFLKGSAMFSCRALVCRGRLWISPSRCRKGNSIGCEIRCGNCRTNDRQPLREARRLQRVEATNRWTAADEQALGEIKAKILKNPPNRQGTPAIAENVIVRLQIAADAEPGEREIRLGAAAGLSNPLKLEIGSLPEFPSRRSGRRTRSSTASWNGWAGRRSRCPRRPGCGLIFPRW
jgi:hypothetical protein